MLLNETDMYPYSLMDLSDRDCLVIAPHPDDESIGCGGSINKHVRRGGRAKVIFLTDGQKGDFSNFYGDGYAGKRRDSAVRALSALGVKEYEFLGFEDRALNQVRDEVFSRTRRIVETFRPGVIYVTSPYEPNPDHRTAAYAGMELFNVTGIDTAFYEVLVPLYPNGLVNITAESPTKESPIKCYDTELYYRDYLYRVDGLNRMRTATLTPDVRYAESLVLFNEEYREGIACRLLREMIERGALGSDE
jgi:LmbE family N-acetylglucosaminyl deacetylase